MAEHAYTSCMQNQFLDTLISDAETKNDLGIYIVSKLAMNRTANISIIIVRLTNNVIELQN